MRISRAAVALTALASIALLTGPRLAAADDAQDAAAVVAAFNAAMTERNLEKTTMHLLEGGVQFNLQPAHTGPGVPQGISSNLKAHWSMVAPVLFSSTKSYSRKAEILAARAMNGIATVWTNTTTESVRGNNPAPVKARFTEVYMLVQQDGQWKIGAIADARKPNDVGLSGAPPAR